MAGTIGEVDIIIGGDASSFAKTAQQVGKDAGNSIQRDLGARLSKIGKSFEAVGSKLTKAITVPALGVAGAAAGITASFGWKRLVGIDTAQAQLKGLGYSTSDVERISGQLTEALEGGMLTMGEATSAAASGMAAGVKEGKELKRYIQLLDAAVVGGTGSFEEMNQIFARIQGSGKLMTNELDMIEQRMPGFAEEVAEDLGVPPEKMREMVSAGKVSSDQFLDIMEGFAGDMATEYAKSWEGMVQNTKTYIGIIGESLLSGVFEKSKESIAQFIKLLKSPEVAAWAEETGKKLRDAFSTIDDTIIEVVTAFAGLPGPLKTAAGVIAGLVVSAGPMLLIFGKLLQMFTPLTTAFGVVAAGMRGYSAAASGVAGSVAKVSAATAAQRTAVAAGAGAQTLMAAATTRLKGAFTGLWAVMKANPLITIISILAAVGAALYAFFTQTETGQELWGKLMDAMAPVGEFLSELGGQFAELAGNLLTALGPAIDSVIGAFGGLIEAVMPVLTQLGTTLGTVFGDMATTVGPMLSEMAGQFGVIFGQLAATAGPILQQIGTALGQIVTQLAPLIPMFMQAGQQIIAAFLPVVTMIVTQLLPVLAELVTTLVPKLLPVFAALVPVVMLVVAAVVPLVTQLVGALVPVIMQLVTTLLPVLMQVFAAIIPIILQVVAALLPLIQTILGILIPVIQALLNVVVTVFQAIAPIIQAALQIVIGVINVVIGVLTGNWSKAWQGILTILKGVWNLIKSVVMGAINIVKSVITNGINLVKGVWTSVWNGIKSLFTSIWNGIKSAAESFITGVKTIITTVVSAIQEKWTNTWNRIRAGFLNVVRMIVSAAQRFVSTVRSKFGQMLSFLQSIPGKIMGFFSGMGSMLVNSGKALIDGFKQGVMNAFSSVKSAVSDGVQSIRNLFPFSPAKEGPFSGRGWVSYSGESLGNTFAQSAADALRAGVSDVSGALDPFQGALSTPAGLLPMSRSMGAPRATSTGTGTTDQPIVIQGPLVNVENARMDSDDRVRQLAQELWNRSNKTSRAQGKINLGGVVR